MTKKHAKCQEDSRPVAICSWPQQANKQTIKSESHFYPCAQQTKQYKEGASLNCVTRRQLQCSRSRRVQVQIKDSA